MNDTLLWYATRGAGIVSLVLLTGVVVLGIVSVMRWQTASWPRFLTTGFHRNLALTTLIFLAIHVVTAVVDPFTALGWEAAIVPFSSPGFISCSQSSSPACYARCSVPASGAWFTGSPSRCGRSR